MGVAYHIAPIHILQKSHTVTACFLPAITGSFWMATDHEPGLCSKYVNIPLVYNVNKYLSQI